MPEYLAKIKDQILELWGKLGKWQKIAIGAGAGALVLAVVLLIAVQSRTDWAVLFSDLSEQDAATIVSRLKEEGVAYRLEAQGTTILIPRKLVYEKRLQFAAEGIPQNGIVGYEIFDRNNIGLTDFVQKLNYKRALEGELARTIQNFEEVRFARVHIMVPEPTLFIEQEKPASASVVVSLVPGKRLKPEQVEGIAHLVASSVEGLEVANVKVIDSHGKVLSRNRDENSLVELTANQLELQRRVEGYFEEKLGALLSGVVGPNNYIVKVTAELDFNQVERTTESYDPESSTIRSQESDIQTGTDPNNPTRSENVITNYEISKTVERVVGGVGTIRRLSVAVMVNGTYQTTVTPDGEEITEYLPRSEEEIQKIRNLVQNAIGFDPKRNDQIEVTNLPFDLTELERQEQYWQDIQQKDMLNRMAFRVSIILAAILLFFLVRGIFNYLRPELPEPEPEEEIPQDVFELPGETRLRVQKREMLVDIARDRPDEVAKLVKSWMINLEEEEWSTRN